MSALKKYTLEGKEAGTVALDERVLKAEANSQMVKDYLVAIRNNMRQWSASTKGRAEVKHTTRKPYRQKGTGNARAGSLVAPQFKGGGIVFGPKPKFDQHVKINRKEKLQAIRFLLAEKARQEQIVVLEDPKLKAPKTKTVVKFLKGRKVDRRVLFIGAGAEVEVQNGDEVRKVSVRSKDNESLALSLRNLQKAEFAQAKNISGYKIARAHHLVITESALKELNQWLGE